MEAKREAMSDWAAERAREWLAKHSERFTYYGHDSATGAPIFDSLAALLREVRHDPEAEVLHPIDGSGYCSKCREAVLAEVRRVVEAGGLHADGNGSTLPVASLQGPPRTGVNVSEKGRARTRSFSLFGDRHDPPNSLERAREEVGNPGAAVTSTPDWAREKAREWLDKRAVSLAEYSHGLSHYQWIEVTDEEHTSLAAMLREVAAIDAGHEWVPLAEVRRIIGEVREKYARLSGHRDQRVLLADDLLARLEKL